MKKIKINGVLYPCRITMGAMLRFKRETGRDVSSMSSDDISDMIVFMWACAASACAHDGVEFGMTIEQFADSLEPDSVQAFYADEVSSDGSKKKGPGKVPTA